MKITHADMRSRIAGVTFGLVASLCALPGFAQTVAADCATPGNDGDNAAVSGIVNTYYPGNATSAAGSRCVYVGTSTGAATPISNGDLLLVVQMQYATINSTDTSSYGDGTAGAPGGVTNYQTSGSYEFVMARGAVGTNGFGSEAGCGSGSTNRVAIKGRGAGGGLINAYTNGARTTSTGRQTFQVIRVPQYNKATLSGALTAGYWNGSTGGIAVIDVVGRFDLAGSSINADGRGFRGGGGRGLGGDGTASDVDFASNVTQNVHGAKGEGIAGTTRYLYNQETGALIDFATDEGYENGGSARGAPGNAGGGGTDGNVSANDQNSGGGGGGNGGSGGIGGNAWTSQEVNGGDGGGAFAPGGTALDRIVLGGGGGAGSRNNSVNRQSSGGAGGGIIIVQTGQFIGTGSISANGAKGPTPDNDGGGGGGAGGTVVLRDSETIASSNATGITISVVGANGTDAWPTQAPGGTPGERHGPGGGGGGGRILLGPTLPTGAQTFGGGAAAITTTANDTYGAGPGLPGSSASYTGTPPGILPGFQCAPLPISLAHIDLRADGGKVQALWATAAERNTVSFRWFADADAKIAVQTDFTASPRGNSAEPTAYQATLRPAATGNYWLAEYDHRGNRSMHGPYQLGRPIGKSPVAQMIPWSKVHAMQRVQSKQIQGSALGARLWVSELGFQRVRYEDLLMAGIDLTGIDVHSLAVTRSRAAVARRIVSASAQFGPGDYIEFFAEPRKSLYGSEAVYRLSIAPALVRAIEDDPRAPGRSMPAWVWTRSEYAPQNAYNFASPSDDPWYADRLLAYQGTPASLDVSLAVSEVAQVSNPAQLDVALIGATNWSGSDPDHQVRLRVNNVDVDQVMADGLVEFGLQYQQSLLTSTSSVPVRVTATGATGYSFDVVNVERVQLRYPRLPAAEANRWFGQDVMLGGVGNDSAQDAPYAATSDLLADGFEEGVAVAQSGSLRVRDLGTAEVTAYARTGDVWRHLSDVRTSLAGASWNAFVPTIQSGDDVYVASDDAMSRPRISADPVLVDIRSGSASYLVISHGLFADAMSPLLQVRQGQGLTTSVVDVEQIYAQFGDGEPDPAAIQSYIAFAFAQRGTRYLLLVGGDTYDYHDFLGVGSISFVPTLYRATSDVVRYAPLDSVFADVDNDGVPDLAIGRLPVRTRDELAIAMAKIIQAETPRANHSALLVSGASDPGNSFAGMNDDFAAELPEGWSSIRADIDGMGVGAARAAMFSGWASGPALVSYVGHSAPGQWTFDPLLTVADVDALTSSPVVPTVAQWGCWNTYFVSPTADSLGQALLLRGPHGAAAVFGAASLTDISNHLGLAPPMFSELVPGKRIGDSILQARKQLAAKGHRSTESMEGGNLLGDPAMVLP